MFNSIKPLITLVLVMAFCNANAQEQQSNLVLDASHFKVIDSLQALQVENTAYAIPLVDIKADYWENTQYNPYKEVELTFPIQIQFEDSSYTSPIGIDKVVTSRYGWRRGRGHKGIDIDLVTGDSVYAMFDGIVRFARYNTGHGKTIVVRHYNGLETTYAHLSKYAVKENDTVQAGDFLGKGGATGNARGSHLHLVVSYKGVSINPEYLFDFDDHNTIRGKELWVTKKWTRPAYHSSKRQSKIIPLFSKEEAIASLEKQREVYIVRSGDTLSRISTRNNVTITSICKTNAIRRNAVLHIGQKIIIEK